MSGRIRQEFELVDLEQPHGKPGGAVVIENGQLFIHLDQHGNSSSKSGEILGIQLDMGIARLVVFRDINSEEPTESLDLDGALESKRGYPCAQCNKWLPSDEIVWANKDGSLSTDTGYPYCVACVPEDQKDA